MDTFRKRVLVSLIILAATLVMLSRIEWLPIGDSIGALIDLALSDTFLPLTAGMIIVFILLWIWNPGSSPQ